MTFNRTHENSQKKELLLGQLWGMVSLFWLFCLEPCRLQGLLNALPIRKRSTIWKIDAGMAKNAINRQPFHVLGQRCRDVFNGGVLFANRTIVDFEIHGLLSFQGVDRCALLVVAHRLQGFAPNYHQLYVRCLTIQDRVRVAPGLVADIDQLLVSFLLDVLSEWVLGLAGQTPDIVLVEQFHSRCRCVALLQSGALGSGILGRLATSGVADQKAMDVGVDSRLLARIQSGLECFLALLPQR